MTSTTEVEAARLEFLATGRCTASDMVVRREVRASWERSLGHGVDPHQLNVRFVGHHSAAPLVDARAEEAFDEFLGAETGAGCSVVLVDPSGVIRVRRDADPALGTLLDALRMVPGYAYGEHEIGTTAASIALHEQADTTLHGGEHFHAELAGLAAAAALVVDRKDGEVAGVVVVLSAAAGRGPLQKVLARAIADRLTKKLASQHHRRARIVLERFREEDQHGEWVLATDGEFVLTNPAARTNPGSPIYGMPILNVDEAKSIIVLKRSMRSGFAGIENELYYNPKTAMLFGDAKASVNEITEELKTQ